VPVDITLRDFREDDAATIVGWVESAAESLAWASVPFLRLTPEILDDWHALPGVVIRVVRGERAAFATYHAAGFLRMDRAEEEQLNLDQDRQYVWMRLGPSGRLPGS